MNAKDGNNERNVLRRKKRKPNIKCNVINKGKNTKVESRILSA